MEEKLYSDVMASINILGTLIKEPSLLEDTASFAISVDDFTVRLHKIIFSAVNNLHTSGMSKIEAVDISHYLESNGTADQKLLFDRESGLELIEKALEISDRQKFGYYYHKTKKLRVLREMFEHGYDTKTIYDPMSIDFDERERQLRELEEMSLEDLVERIQKNFDTVMSQFQFSGVEKTTQAGDSILELLAEFDSAPAIGYPTYDPILTKVMMGNRLGKYSILSAVSGGGKTRQMAGMCAATSATHVYEPETGEWKELFTKVPTLFIATEQGVDEIQTLLLAWISKVNEERIIDPSLYEMGERERVIHAAKILQNSPIHIATLPDFGIADIENTIKKGIQDHGIKMCFFDYINTSIKMLGELSRRTSVNMREDQVLYLLSTRLKELAVTNHVGLMTATQTNRTALESSEANSGMLKGSSAIVEKADFAAIMMRLTPEDKKQLPFLLSATSTDASDAPNLIMSIYKNRRGRYSEGKLWMKVDLGTCTFKTVFYTDHDYQVHKISGYEIEYTN